MSLYRHLPTAVIAKQLIDRESQANVSVWLDSQQQLHSVHTGIVKITLFVGDQDTVDANLGDWIVQDPALHVPNQFYVLPADDFHAAFYDAESDRLLDTATEIDREVGGTLAAPEYRGDSIIQSVRAVLANIAARLRNIHHERTP